MKLLLTALSKMSCYTVRNKFDFDKHVTSLCRKASQKLYELIIGIM